MGGEDGEAFRTRVDEGHHRRFVRSGFDRDCGTTRGRDAGSERGGGGGGDRCGGAFDVFGGGGGSGGGCAGGERWAGGGGVLRFGAIGEVFHASGFFAALVAIGERGFVAVVAVGDH